MNAETQAESVSALVQNYITVQGVLRQKAQEFPDVADRYHAAADHIAAQLAKPDVVARFDQLSLDYADTITKFDAVKKAGKMSVDVDKRGDVASVTVKAQTDASLARNSFDLAEACYQNLFPGEITDVKKEDRLVPPQMRFETAGMLTDLFDAWVRQAEPEVKGAER